MRSPAEVIEENNRQKYLARREAARRRGMTHRPVTPGGVGHSTVTRHLPTPWLALAVGASLGGVFALAVFGAFTLIHEVFGVQG